MSYFAPRRIGPSTVSRISRIRIAYFVSRISYRATLASRLACAPLLPCPPPMCSIGHARVHRRRPSRPWFALTHRPGGRAPACVAPSLKTALQRNPIIMHPSRLSHLATTPTVNLCTPPTERRPRTRCGEDAAAGAGYAVRATRRYPWAVGVVRRAAHFAGTVGAAGGGWRGGGGAYKIAAERTGRGSGGARGAMQTASGGGR